MLACSRACLPRPWSASTRFRCRSRSTSPPAACPADDGRAAGRDGAREPRPRANRHSQRGFPFPGTRVTVSLAPADLRKVGAAFDLPIALGILAASGAAAPSRAQPLHRSSAAVARRQRAADARPAADRGGRAASRRGPDLSRRQPAEAGIVDRLRLFPVHRCSTRRACCVSPIRAGATAPALAGGRRRVAADDLADVRGQSLGRRALEIAAAGAHHLLLQRPAGRGQDDAGAAAARAAAAADASTRRWRSRRFTRWPACSRRAPASSTQRPFRAPHHTCSDIALVGGGIDSAAGRAQPRAPRRAVSRRAAGVQPARARDAAAAARAARRAHRARRPLGHLSRRRHARRRR